MQGKRLLRLVDNVRSCTSRAELEGLAGVPVCSVRTWRLRELHGEDADRVLIEEYNLGDYTVLLGFRHDQVYFLAGRVNPNAWDEALRREGVALPESPCVEIRLPSYGHPQAGEGLLIQWL